MSYPTILEVVPGSPAASAGLSVGDELVAVNGVRPGDIIEYQQLVDEPDPGLTLRRSGVEQEIVIDKGVGEPLGLRLSASIFDRVQTCDNHCEFCFIYQLPPGMRKSLYLKDDDYRLSFLYGNFTTLTRFTELDLSRVVEERLGPLYVSIHATDPDIRSRMLRNPRGATSLRWLRGLLERGVTVHGQVVLCPDVNAADVLARTCAEVVTRYPSLASVGVVPLGVSRYNKEPSLVPHTRAQARRDLDIIHTWQEIALARLGRRMFFASDELYLMADLPFPDTDSYEDYPQHENGIGMVRAWIFADPQQREDLNRITHPAVAALSVERLTQLVARGEPLIVYEAPLLFEAGAERRVDAVLVVRIDPLLQLQRLGERDGIGEKEARDRIAAQMPQEEKVARADYVIDNSGSPEETEAQVRNLFRRLMHSRSPDSGGSQR
jgi:putative radical SAM enzyme (TIGR03279 family)